VLLRQPQEALPVGGLLIIRRLGRSEPRIRGGFEPSTFDEIQLGHEGVNRKVGAAEAQLPLSFNPRLFVMTHVE